MTQEDLSKRTPPPTQPNGSAVQDVKFTEKKTTPASGRPTRIGLWALVLGFGGFLVWAGLAPLDEGVPGAGMVAIDTKRKSVQHLSGGIIKEVLVGEGDPVKEGQLLIRLDETLLRAGYESIRQRYLGLRAMESRLQAEQRGSAAIGVHPDVQQASSDPQIREVLATQQQLFQSRRSSLQADLRSIEESIQGQEAMILAYDTILVNRKQQQALLNEELNNTRGLVSEGYVPRNRQLELERSAAELSSGIAELQGNTMRARRAIGELRQRTIVRQQEYRKDVESQLADVGREVQADASKFKAAKEELGRLEIRSPASGQVVGLAFQTVGGVIGPGQKLMDVVPQDQALLVEARVPPHLIDRVHSNLAVDVRFSSFAHSPQLVVDGKVVSVSGDLLVEPQTGVGYFLARVAVTAEGYKKLGNRQLQPGMPVEVVFLTGERSLLTYLVHPLTKRLAASMKEE